MTCTQPTSIALIRHLHNAFPARQREQVAQLIPIQACLDALQQCGLLARALKNPTWVLILAGWLAWPN